MDLFSERFLPLIEKSGKPDQELEKAMGLPRSIIYDWKNGRNKSSYKKYAGNFAEYFNVSADYLLGRTDDPEGFKKKNVLELATKPETLEFMRLFEQLADDKKLLVINVMKGFLDEKK